MDDVAALYAADPRPPHPDGRPWVLLNMVASVDGATSVDGVSGSLGGDADRAVFAAIRAVADVILVGAGTVRAEGYGAPRPSAAARAAREARGRPPAPRLAIVTSSVDLDPRAPLFADAEPANHPFVVTALGALPERLAAIAAVTDEVIVAGDGRVDSAMALQELGHRGAQVVLCEGGPSLNGQLIAAGVVDEVCLTVAPVLASGDSARIARGPAPVSPLGLRLDRALEADGTLWIRYVRA
ncbi:MAG: dihydrofolate reductase family protein [Acidimicrobiales bacterium]